MLVVTPPMKAKQDVSARLDGTEIVVGRLRERQPEKGLIPLKAAGNVPDADYCP
jgi:hypothetical protein